MSKPALPPRVHAKGRWYYLVTSAPDGKRPWTKLSKIRDGEAALYRKLAEIKAQEVAPDRIPALIVAWKKEVGATRTSKKAKANDDWVMGVIEGSFVEFTARQVTSPVCAEFLKRWRVKPADWDEAKEGPWKARPRTHNVMRSGLKELMRYAEEKGFRDAGSNPVSAIKTMKDPARDRYGTDSEIRRIKVAAFKGADGKPTRQGATVACLIDLAYLTGQRVGDLLDLRWNRRAALDAKGNVAAPYIADEGLYFKPSKTAGSSGAKVLIQWTPRLRAVIERIKAIGRRHLTHVVTSQDAQPYEYEAFKSAWARAVKRSGVKGLTFNDLRAKAITDKEDAEDMKAASAMGAHSTETQTSDYVRRRKPRKTEATR